MATTDAGGDDGRIQDEARAVDFAQYRARRLRARLLDLLDVLIAAMERRDLRAVWAVLDDDAAVRWFPDGLREEAVVIASLPRASLRAPMRAYRFYQQLRQLADEPLERSGDPRQLALDFGPEPALGTAIRFPERPAAPPDDPRQGGDDRRRSGAR